MSISAGTRLRFSRDLLRPVTSDSGDWVDDPTRKHAEIVISAGIEIRDDWSVNIIGANEFRLAPSMISDSGFVIEGTLALDLSDTSSLPETLAMGLGNSWRGAVFKTLTFHLPDDLEVPILPTDLTLTNFHIGSSGISGSVRGNWSPTISGNQISGSGTGTLFGIPFGLKKLNLDLLQSAVTGIEIKGILGLPFFDQALDVELSLDLDGNISLAVDSTTGLKEFTLSSNSTEVMRVEVAHLTVEQYQGVLTVGIGGSIIPRFGGLDWPTFDVQKLSIDSNGNVHLEGGWLTLRKQKPLNFYGFQMEITKLGFGRTEDGGKWIGFSGGVKLVEGLPAGASVEGLRIVWYDDGSKAPSVTFNGVGVEFQVPGVLFFKGSVAYSGLVELPRPEGVEKIQRFDGGIKLKLVALNMEIDATLVIGSASGPRGNYTFFAIYLGVELPAGIPLFSTGVALYGMAGLFATQMEPNKRDDEGWYESPDGNPGWYKRGTPGVTDLKTKWDPRLGSLAFGVGATLGTVPDNGTSFHGKFLLVIVFPGPIVLLEGRGDLLKKRASPDKPGTTTIVEEPLFRALAVLDNRVGTFTIGLDAQYKYNAQGALIDIHGGVEAFFCFSDANAWHIYLGRDEPIEHRIHALIFKNLFEANAYFMLDPSSVRTGAWMGIDKNWWTSSASRRCWLERLRLRRHAERGCGVRCRCFRPFPCTL